MLLHIWIGVPGENLNRPDKEVVFSKDGEVLETSMDNIELNIARDYLRKNLRFMREEYA